MVKQGYYIVVNTIKFNPVRIKPLLNFVIGLKNFYPMSLLCSIDKAPFYFLENQM